MKINKKNQKIYIAGHQGMVGSALIRILLRQGHEAKNLITIKHRDLDLTNQTAVRDFFYRVKPDQVYLAAAKVGGIYANNCFPADFIYQNLMIQSNVINAAFSNNVRKLLFLGSSCIYPKLAGQPISEDSLLTGSLEPTNEPYAIAKIAGIKLCESYNRQYGDSHGVDYRSVMPTNLYGPGDNYHPENSHVIPAMIRRFHRAKLENAPFVTIWGTGNARREFLYVDDMALACTFVMNLDVELYSQNIEPRLSHINVGYGKDISILELSQLVKDTVGYQGNIKTDMDKPDGTPRKLLDSSRINSIGWRPSTSLQEGIEITYKHYLKDHGLQ